MNKLFDDLCQGLISQGYKEYGNCTSLRIFTKDDNEIKVFINKFHKPNSIITRYSYKKDDFKAINNFLNKEKDNGND